MKPDRAWRLIRMSITALVLYSLWLVFTASADLFSLLTGAVGSLAVAALTHGQFIAGHEASLRSFAPRPLALAGFLAFLIYSMYASSFAVLAAVITGRISPRVVHFRTRLNSDLARMVIANAITLTPGTITLDLNDDHLTVHWLLATTRHSRAAGDLVKGRFEERLKRVWS
ncbi:MAG TPA: Na+/H+ antiporter subunit E [Spirochaetales bacterium]|nr:Na+/H+ antiporter subunit E [Spirochaetales bacterium]